MSGCSTKLLKTDTHKSSIGSWRQTLLKAAVGQTPPEVAYKTCLRSTDFCITDMSRDRTRCRSTNVQFRGQITEIREQMAELYPLFRFVSFCFGYSSFGLTQTLKLAVSIIEAKQPKQRLCFGYFRNQLFGPCFESNLVSKDTLQAYTVYLFTIVV